VSPHPAPWPLLNLDVAAVRGAGLEPVPFQQFIVKVHSRCNLSCSYCYRAGSGFRHRSVYCADLLRLITHVRDRVGAALNLLTTALSPR